MRSISRIAKDIDHHLFRLAISLLPLFMAYPNQAGANNHSPLQIYSPLLVENHSDVLVPWIQTGIRNAVVVNVDAHDDCIPITEEHLQKLRSLFTTGNMEAIGNANGVTDSSLYDISNFITAAHAIGVAREVVWGVPLPGELSKVYTHLPFQVRLIDSLATMKIEGPVFLTVDADCVDRYASYQCINLVEAVRRIATTLRAVPWEVKHLSISFSHDGGYLPVTLRWVGYALKDALEGNDVNRPGAAWQMLVEAEDWRRSLLPTGIIKKTRPLIQKHPEIPWLHTYMADALFRADSLDAAFAEGKQAMSLDAGCAYILAEIGGELANMGRYVEAERFLAEAPTVINAAAELALAQWMDGSGQIEGAIRHYLRINMKVANYSTDLLLGYCYERLGNTGQARHHYARAVSLLTRPVSEMAGFADLTSAVAAAEQFLRKNGEPKAARILRHDHRLALYFRKRE